MTSEAAATDGLIPLDLSVLQGVNPAQENGTGDALDHRLLEVTRLIDKGRYREAACAAQRGLETGDLDIRLLGYFLPDYPQGSASVRSRSGIGGVRVAMYPRRGIIAGIWKRRLNR